ncbi:dihydrouridine synthase domain-containing protein, putative [Eimeria praecox]|uniref:Dihydrouridine synthase domain-containing protein, putative n=1 Tax=Eimeria praecox TaxID=51316 RepID=U6GP59_9EIME|nr:dihydrouridine synthase domain-containing protein, putative [Eimeria praecox]
MAGTRAPFVACRGKVKEVAKELCSEPPAEGWVISRLGRYPSGMHCATSESPTSKGTKLQESVTDEQRLREGESDDPTGCEYLASSCATNGHAELVQPANQAPMIGLGRSTSTVECSGREFEPSKNVSNGTQGQDHCLRKRGASHTTESEGIADEIANGGEAADTLPGGGMSNSELHPRPLKFPRPAPQSVCGEGAVTEAVKTADQLNEEPHLGKTKEFSALQEMARETDSAENVLDGFVPGELPNEQRQSGSVNASELYQSAWILAPMVRISTLPFRLECLKYGADIVYSEEIVDRKLIDSKRYINKDFGTIEYIHKSDRRCVFSTCDLEKGKVVLQLGTADAARALQAATIAMQDIAAVDINMGCPKSFSYAGPSHLVVNPHQQEQSLQVSAFVRIAANKAKDILPAQALVKGGMGAALLQAPDVAMDILKTLTRNVTCPVTCKIRLLETMEEDSDKNLKLDLVAANSTAKVCTVFGLDHFYNGIEHVPYANTLNYYKYIELK